MLIVGVVRLSSHTSFTILQEDQATTIGRALFQAYDPIVNKELLNQRVTHPCKVYLPSKEEMDIHPKRNEWSLSRFTHNNNIDKFLTERWQNRTKESPRLRLLDASGSAFLTPFHDLLERTTTNYPDTDMHRTKYEDNSFDVVSADQVLEHTYLPHLVMLEIHRILKPGGIAILTTVAFNPLHESTAFHDLWRFMVDGMLALSMPFEGGIKLCGGWGTARVISTRSTHGMGSGEETRVFTEEFSEQLSKNEVNNPFVVWLIVEK